jgi:DNA-binding FadR family transcriptional regulator
VKIKTLIFKGILRPGDKLPSETELARQFKVGRQTVREALRLLEISGLITIQRGSSGGPLIENTILNTLSNLFLDAFQMRTITTEEIAVARLEIEKAMLNHIVKNADQSDIRSLRENILQAKKNAAANINPYLDNIQFHKLLAKASKNQIFIIVVESMMAIIGDFLSRLKPKFEHSRKVISEHEGILNEIIKKNTRKATRLLEEHIVNVRENMLDPSRTH